MNATLDLNLSKSLNGDELLELTEIAKERDTTIEEILFEAARDLAAARRVARMQQATNNVAVLAS